MNIQSRAFQNGQAIPSIYTCDGENINPPLTISSVPIAAQSLVLIVEDPDSPSGTFTHWLVFNIQPLTSSISENSVPDQAIEGLNDFGQIRYGGPCPGSGTHHYIFKLYALDTTLNLLEGAKKADLINKMQNHILEQAELTGTYKKQ
ncbi:MAG: YbhB/YbcL family Raf kinase inhibitor-like protein [Patescibacteria group bacterium]|nr:YbhB/YbcL family Raf kinase inhibitor-like protein [Patescibacteria group bacterium]